MSEWQEASLGDVLTLQRGFDITKANQRDGAVPVVSSSGINSYHDKAMVESPGVVIGRKGTLGTCFFLDKPFWPHDTTLWVKDFKGNWPHFCYFLLKSLDLAKYDVGAANPTLNRNHLHLLQVKRPSLSVQRRIASILGVYDDLIDVNRRRIAVLEEMAQRLFEEWFIHFRFPGHDAHEMVEISDGSIPKGWRNGVLGDLVEQRRDKAFPGEHLIGRVYVPIDCIGRKTLGLTDTKSWQEAQSSLQLFERHDILFGAMRPYFHKVCPAPMAGITRSTCFVLRPRSPSLFAFSALALFRDETIAFATAHSTGSTIPYATWTGSLERLGIILPPDHLLKRFDYLVRPMIELIFNLCQSSRNLLVARNLLLPRLISGEFTIASAERELEAVA